LAAILSDQQKFTVVGGGTFTSGVSSLPADGGPDLYDAFLLDMDGVLHRTGTPIDGAGDFLTFLRDEKNPFILLTNECRYTNQWLANHLQEILGVGPDPHEIYSAANSARDFFDRLLRHGFDDSVYVVGEQGLIENVRQAFKRAKRGRVYAKDEPVASNDDDAADDDGSDNVDGGATKVAYVVIGSVHEENTRFSERAAEFVRNGARLVYTCPDWFDRDNAGRLAFGMPMPLVTLIEKTTGCESYNLGKPNSR
jgi:HAD superfamily hydrolase (TIGR01450 family)